jgi:S1/P1 Nuclease
MIRKNFIFIVNNFLLSLWLFPILSYAWDPAGHKIVAAIAYSHLTPIAKRQIDQITEVGDSNYPAIARFLYASPLPDIWRESNPATGSWHFYNEPWSTDGTPTVPTVTANFVTALQRNIAILANPAVTLNQKYIALAWVEHLVADAHQPLHCINHFSKDFPHGDMGGNLFLIKNSDADNLHSYWDQIFQGLSNAKIKRLSEKLQTQYPIKYFGNKSNDLNFNHWENECYQLAKANVYNGISPNHKLPSQYKTSAREIAQSQLTIAGYRLAELLNNCIREEG